MECRKQSRQSIDQPVRLVRQGRVVAIARAVNMSATGVGIECRGGAFEPGQIVEVDFYKPGYPRGVSCCLHAEVVHAGPGLMGLMFANDESTKTLAEEEQPSADA